MSIHIASATPEQKRNSGVQTKCNYSLNCLMHFKTVRGPGVNSAKFRDLKIRSVDGFGLDEKASEKRKVSIGEL